MDKRAILETAASIGRSIRDSELMDEFLSAQADFAKDAELQAAIAEYSVQQEALSGAAGGQFQDPEVADAIRKRIDELYGIISRNPNFEAFEKVRGALGGLLDEINSTITHEMAGSDTGSGCTGNCASCGGCH
ncbi:MAG: YlbF family regulator [Clostridia bacterium]|nr:YlbF family regulator [Clostridia bacterium]